MSSKQSTTYGSIKDAKPFECAFCGETITGKGAVLDIFEGCIFCDYICRDKCLLSAEILAMEMDGCKS